MNAIELEARPLYGIGTVARLTRIKPGTLRIWDRRYQLGASYKSKTGRRMYTQTDLEHLQIVSSLFDKGYRIGEIAGMEGKTLAALLDQAGASSQKTQRVKTLFLGQSLCAWLDQHGSVVSGLDARLLREDLATMVAQGSLTLLPAQIFVVSVGSLSRQQFELIQQARAQIGNPATLVVYEFGNPHWVEQLAEQGITSLKSPLDAERVQVQITRLRQMLEVEQGNVDVGDLASLKPRLFDAATLERLEQVDSLLPCGCTHHLAELIRSLANFEQYSGECAVEGWSDAATHACVHTYVNQARFLMERALQSVLEEKQNNATEE